MADPFLVPFKRQLDAAPQPTTSRVAPTAAAFSATRQRRGADAERLARAKKTLAAKKHALAEEGVADDALETRLRGSLETDALDRHATHTKLADGLHLGEQTVFKSRRLSKECTAVVLHKADQTKAFVACANGVIFTYDITANAITGQLELPPARGDVRPAILSLALSHDSKLLVAATSQKDIRVIDPETLEQTAVMKGHQDKVVDVVFRDGTYELYSASSDRSVKVWNAERASLMTTLYGHRSGINAIDALTKERCVTASSDQSVRVFKVAEESQLVYNAYDPADAVTLLNENSFVVGGFGGGLSLYGVNKKTPLCHHDRMHQEVTTVCAVRYSDTFFSGGVEGTVKMWKVDADFAKGVWGKGVEMEEIGKVDVGGVVNGIDVAADHSFFVCATGKRFRLGNWNLPEKATNTITVVKLSCN